MMLLMVATHKAREMEPDPASKGNTKSGAGRRVACLRYRWPKLERGSWGAGGLGG